MKLWSVVDFLCNLDNHTKWRVKMTLQLKMKLSDLQEEEANLITKKNQLHNPQKLEIIESIRGEIISFLTKQGLAVEYAGKMLNGNYKGANYISVNFNDFTPEAPGSDGVFVINYNDKKYVVSLLLDRADKSSANGMVISSSEKERLEKMVRNYEENILPKLRDSSVIPLPGTYILLVSKERGQPDKYKNVEDLLSYIVN